MTCNLRFQLRCIRNSSDFPPGIAGRISQRFFAPLRMTILFLMQNLGLNGLRLVRLASSHALGNRPSGNMPDGASNMLALPVKGEAIFGFASAETNQRISAVLHSISLSDCSQAISSPSKCLHTYAAYRRAVQVAH